MRSWVKILSAIPVAITIFGLIASGIWWIRDVNGYGGRITTLETDDTNSKMALAVMSNEVHNTKDEVHDIWQYLHLDRMKK